MVIICKYIDEARRVENFLLTRGVEVGRYTTNDSLDTFLAVNGRLSPAFQRTFWEWINDQKLNVEAKHE